MSNSDWPELHPTAQLGRPKVQISGYEAPELLRPLPPKTLLIIVFPKCNEILSLCVRGLDLDWMVFSFEDNYMLIVEENMRCVKYANLRRWAPTLPVVHCLEKAKEAYFEFVKRLNYNPRQFRIRYGNCIDPSVSTPRTPRDRFSSRWNSFPLEYVAQRSTWVDRSDITKTIMKATIMKACVEPEQRTIPPSLSHPRQVYKKVQSNLFTGQVDVQPPIQNPNED